MVRLRVGSVFVEYDVYPCGWCEGKAMQVRLLRDRRLWSKVVLVRGMGIERYVGARVKEKCECLEAPVGQTVDEQDGAGRNIPRGEPKSWNGQERALSSSSA